MAWLNELPAVRALLAAARQWPEVEEALATAFRLFQERRGAGENKAELEPIKVNQGEINLENEDAHNETENAPTGCGDEPSPPRGHRLPDSRCAKPAVGGVRMNENLAKLKRIKVDQGDNFYPERERASRWGNCSACSFSFILHRCRRLLNFGYVFIRQLAGFLF
ncbi:MAG TPA: hypothetical protein VK815_14825 [Candidatus Acidoferrales bacterium]|nr:hypothetical protein [Candidatus Acidoferrales bacterium]